MYTQRENLFFASNSSSRVHLIVGSFIAKKVSIHHISIESTLIRTDPSFSHLRKNVLVVRELTLRNVTCHVTAISAPYRRKTSFFPSLFIFSRISFSGHS